MERADISTATSVQATQKAVPANRLAGRDLKRCTCIQTRSNPRTNTRAGAAASNSGGGR